jgi:hypothetical protein
MSEPFNAIQVVMMPRDTNPFGTIVGVVFGNITEAEGARQAIRRPS